MSNRSCSSSEARALGSAARTRISVDAAVQEGVLPCPGECPDPWLNAILSRVQAVPPIAPRPRHSRDIRLGAAAAILAGSVAVLAAADILGLVDLFDTNWPAGFRIASGCKVMFDLILIPAFTLSSVAFLSQAERRARRLEIGATLGSIRSRRWLDRRSTRGCSQHRAPLFGYLHRRALFRGGGDFRHDVRRASCIFRFLEGRGGRPQLSHTNLNQVE